MNDTPHSAPHTSRRALRDVRRFVVKIGTNVICKEDGSVAQGRIVGLLAELADLQRGGREVIIVSSGAISLGIGRLGSTTPARPSLVDKQAYAAVGQSCLMELYQRELDGLGIATAQVLLTEDDFSDRARYLSLRNTLSRLLELRVIPIVNENDTVSTTEIETRLEGSDAQPVFGDNDVLSALVASKLGAELLVILSDVDGLYESPPDSSPDARRISIVTDVTSELERCAQGGSKRGRGGMRTKLRAAKVAAHSGTMVVIARGADAQVVTKILSGDEIGTFFTPLKPLSSRKRWIAFATTVAGRVHVNSGAKDALVERRASLLFAGVSKLDSEFSHGDIVSIHDESGVEFARGITNHSSGEARKLVGRRTEEIRSLLGAGEPATAPELIHRDNIVILRNA